MKQEIETNTKEIIQRLAKLQLDIEYIKKHIFLEDKEMKMWEEASEEDIVRWEKENL